jgi:uncharacterized protein YecE (DUF72 family)
MNHIQRATRNFVPARIYVGSSSWVDKNLIDSGRFYPPEAKDTDARLAFYAKQFDLAEIDSTYYALPSKKNVERWAAAVPSGFRFNVKAFALFTQHPTQTRSIPKSFHDGLPPEVLKKARVYEKDVPPDVTAELWRVFRAALAPMRDEDKLGATLLDFPPWWVPSKANRDYLRRTREHLDGENVLVEFRNPLWAGDDTADATFGLLRELGYGFCCVDEPPGLSSSFPPVVAVTAPIAAVRFRGRNVERWEDKSAATDEKLNWLYTDKELKEWLPRIRQLAAGADEVYLTFNTKAQDQSVVNGNRLKKLLGMT